MDQFLLIENQGVVDHELLTTIGSSASRFQEDRIGLFGSGFPNAVALLLRKSLEFRVYCGNDGFVFGYKEKKLEDAAGNVCYVNKVFMKGIAGSIKSTTPLGFDVNFGLCDWDDVTMAAREFISNTADACDAQGLSYEGIRIAMVPRSEMVARRGYTRVFIEASDEILDYYHHLNEHFLVFNDDYDPDEVVIPKRTPNSDVRVYRRGVFVGTFEFPSLFDYNLHDVKLRESRIVTLGDAEIACGHALKRANPDRLAEFLRAVREGRETWETAHINRYYLTVHDWERTSEQSQVINANWKSAISDVWADSEIACDNQFQVDPIAMKGYRPVLVSSPMLQVLSAYGVKDAGQVLNQFETSGKTTFPLSEGQMDVCRSVWQQMVELGITKDKPMPETNGYHDVMESGSNLLGYHDPTTGNVGISGDVLSDSPTFSMVKTLLEEDGHYISGARDCTRDFQDFAFRLAAKLVMKFVFNRKDD